MALSSHSKAAVLCYSIEVQLIGFYDSLHVDLAACVSGCILSEHHDVMNLRQLSHTQRHHEILWYIKIHFVGISVVIANLMVRGH